jgi:hypothetical protein
LRVHVSCTTFSSRSRVPGQLTVTFDWVPAQVVFLSVDAAVNASVYGPPTGIDGIVVSTSRSLRTSKVPEVEKPFGPVSV